MVNISDFKGVVVLYNASSQQVKGEEKDLIADQNVVKCAGEIFNALNSLFIQAELVPITEEAESALLPFHPRDWLVFNLAEGLRGKLYEESRITWLLESRAYYFTGSNGRAIALTTNKALTKSFLSRAGLRTPAWWLLHSPDQITRDRNFPFPLFVKPAAEDASLGIGKDSVVFDHQKLQDQVAYINECYLQSALVEEFIDGREINAAAWGNPFQILPLAEIDFQAFTVPQDRIVNYAAKWQDDSFEYHHTPAICPADLPPRLRRKISAAVLQALEFTGASSYARVDLRLTEDEIPYILEINCNPDLSPEAGFFYAVSKTGLTYQEMAQKILVEARRHSDAYSFTRGIR